MLLLLLLLLLYCICLDQPGGSLRGGAHAGLHYFIFFIHSFCSSFFLCFFFLLLLLLGVDCPFGRSGRLPFWGRRYTAFLAGFFLHDCDIACMCEGCSGGIFLWSVTGLTKDESPHRGYTFTPWVVSFYSPWQRAPGRRDLDFTSLPKDSGEPWDRFSVSRLDSLAGVATRNRALYSGHPSKNWPCRMTA